MKLLLIPALLATVVLVKAQTTNGEYHLDKDYAISTTGNMTLRINDAKLSVVGTNRSNAHIKIDRVVIAKGLVMGKDEFRVDIKEETGDLTLSDNSGSISVIGSYSEKYKIEIELPVGVSLNIVGNDGTYDIRTINGAIDIKASDSHIALFDCGGKKFKFRLNDGGIKMDKGQGELEVRADDANVKIQNAKFTSVHASINEGSFIVESSLTDGGEYQIRTEDGSVAFTVLDGGGKFDIDHNDGRVSADSPFSFTEKSDNHSSLTLASGTANVSIRTNDGDVKLAKR